MSVVKVTGGLGNQLFQLAFAIAISKSNGSPVGLDTTFYRIARNRNGRYLHIRNFNSQHFYFCDSTPILTRIASFLLFPEIFSKFTQITDRLSRKVDQYFGLSIQHEQDTAFDPAIEANTNSYFLGSFISPEYWGNHRKEVIEEVGRLFNENFPRLVSIGTSELAIHIRRGDYISNEKARKFHGICSMDYYMRTVSKLLVEFPEIDTIEIFSDEKRFAEELKGLLYDTGLSIKINSTLDAPNALAEMSNSKYFIGCNSTFSWWASVLNSNRISVLPSQWFLDSGRAKISPKFFEPGVRIESTSLE
jgi:hypothetical protein